MPTFSEHPFRSSKIGREFWMNAPCINADCGAPAPNAFFCRNCALSLPQESIPGTAFQQWLQDRAAARKAERAERGISSGFRLRGTPELNLRQAAYQFTKAAIANGFLLPPPDCECADCGKKAECYDHRDYSKPIDVEPVCIACNKRRGAGFMPPMVVTPAEAMKAA